MSIRGLIITLLVIIIVIVGTTLGIYTYTTQKDKVQLRNIPEYQKEKLEEKPEFKSEKERMDYIKEFANKGNVLDEENDKHTYNAGGFKTANVLNLSALVEPLTINGMVLVEEELTLALEMLPIIKQNTLNMNDTEIGYFFSEHQNEIIRQYGIDNLKDFNKFIETLDFIKENEKILEGVIKKESVEKIGNTTSFDLEVVTTEDNKAIYRIKVALIPTENETTYNLYWDILED